MRGRTLAIGFRLVAISVALVLGACTSSDETPEATASSAPGDVEVVIANYEIVAGEPSRLLVGLITPDGRTVAYGSVQMRFAEDTGQPAEATQAVAGTYLPVHGTDPGDPDADPAAVRPATARGVYATYGVRFSSAGPYLIEVAADVQGIGVVQGVGRFEVVGEPAVPGLEEEAPKTQNHTIDSPGIPDASIDSRATTGEIPDLELHRTTIADAIRRNQPALIVFSTPVYCVSRFCGPVTNLVQELAADYRAEAEFIHVEVWRDFEGQVVNEAAAEWIYRDDELTEPWAFLIGPDGRIAARWDNLFTEDELRAALDQLPTNR